MIFWTVNRDRTMALRALKREAPERGFHADSQAKQQQGRKIFSQCEAGFPMIISSSSGEVRRKIMDISSLRVSEQESMG